MRARPPVQAACVEREVCSRHSAEAEALLDPRPAEVASRPRLRVTARYADRRCWVEVDGQPVGLSEHPFVMLLRVAHARLHDAGWVSRLLLGAKANYGWKGKTRLDQQLEEALGAAGRKLLEVKGKSGYRLTLLASEIEIEIDCLRDHPRKAVRDALESLTAAATAGGSAR